MGSMHKNLATVSVIILISFAGYYLFHPEKIYLITDLQNKVMRLFDGKLKKDTSSLTSRDMDIDVKKMPKYLYNIPCRHQWPQAVAVFSDKLYVSYKNLSIIDIYDYYGKYTDSFSPFPGGESDPIWLATDTMGDLYVADVKNRVVLVFDQNHHLRYPFPPRRLNQNSEDFLHVPIAVSTYQRLVYITDMGSNSIKAFLNNGDYLMTIKGLNKNGKKPWHPMGVTICQDGRILVSDVMENKVAVFNCTGKFAYFFEDGDTEGKYKLSAPGAMAIDGLNRVHVIDSLSYRIFVYDNHGRFLFTYGGKGYETSRLNSPWGITIDKTKNLIFIADSKNQQIDVWSY